jgi:hypothetical protein
MKFIINYIESGKQEKYRSTDWTSFEDEVHSIARHIHNGTTCYVCDFEFIINGKVVSFDDAIKAAASARQAWEDKRASTKRPIRILRGVCNIPSNWHTVWVNK